MWDKEIKRLTALDRVRLRAKLQREISCRWEASKTEMPINAGHADD